MINFTIIEESVILIWGHNVSLHASPGTQEQNDKFYTV